MQTTVNASTGPDAARLALKLIEWNYGTLCKVILVNLLPRENLFVGPIKNPHPIPFPAAASGPNFS